MRSARILLMALSLALAPCWASVQAAAQEAAKEPSFRIVFKDGVIEPRRIEAPARTRFRLELVNQGQTPAEFESVELRKEKVIAPGAETVMVIRTLDPGEYSFFDDFHPDAPPAVIVAK